MSDSKPARPKPTKRKRPRKSPFRNHAVAGSKQAAPSDFPVIPEHTPEIANGAIEFFDVSDTPNAPYAPDIPDTPDASPVNAAEAIPRTDSRVEFQQTQEIPENFAETVSLSSTVATAHSPEAPLAVTPAPTKQAQRGKRHIKSMDGLRTLAIAAVIAFHAGIFEGGFLGVSVFFAMSGYLITNSLLKDLARSKTINLKTFISHRLRRLFPTMLVVVLVTALLTALFAPDLLRKMQPDALPALGFFANWWFIFNKLSYFAAAGLPSPLTHFWYLGVLGEFYLVWPFIIWGLSKLGNKVFMRRAVFVIGLASFIAMVVVYVPGSDPNRVYYGTDTRFAELMAGAWLAFVCPLSGKLDFRGLPRGLKRSALALQSRKLSPQAGLIATAALAIIVVMCFTLTGQMDFVYRGGLLIVALLTSVIIFCAVIAPTRFDNIMGLHPFKFIGDRSYQLYLWHYPLLLIMNPATRTTELQWWEPLLQVAIICLVSFASYRYVEQTTGQGQIGALIGGWRNHVFTIHQLIRKHLPLCIACFGIGLAGITLLITGPFWVSESFVPDHQENAQTSHYATGNEAPLSQGGTEMQDKNKTLNAENINILLIGDSIGYGCRHDFYDQFPQGYLDAKVSRQLSAGAEVYQEAINSGYEPDAVVLELGSNDVAQESQIKGFFDAVNPETPVFWINLRVPSKLETTNNKLFPEIMEEYPNAKGHIIDWYSASNGHDDYFYRDGTHLKPTGSKAYLKLISNTVVKTLNKEREAKRK